MSEGSRSFGEWLLSWRGPHLNDEAQMPRSIRTPWDGMGGRKDGWSEPPDLIHGGQAMTTQWVYLPTMPSKAKAGEGGSFLELPSLAVVKNSLMMKQRLVTEKLLSAQADLPSRGGRSVIPGRLGRGMEREAGTGGATSGSWNGAGRGGCKSHQKGANGPW